MLLRSTGSEEMSEMQKEPETPEAKKAREAVQKAREGKLKEKVKLSSSKRELEKKIEAINRSQKGNAREFTGEELRQLRLHESAISRINEQLAAIDRELGS